MALTFLWGVFLAHRTKGLLLAIPCLAGTFSVIHLFNLWSASRTKFSAKGLKRVLKMWLVAISFPLGTFFLHMTYVNWQLTNNGEMVLGSVSEVYSKNTRKGPSHWARLTYSSGGKTYHQEVLNNDKNYQLGDRFTLLVSKFDPMIYLEARRQ